jgi:hypothetical protein
MCLLVTDGFKQDRVDAYWTDQGIVMSELEDDVLEGRLCAQIGAVLLTPTNQLNQDEEEAVVVVDACFGIGDWGVHYLGVTFALLNVTVDVV